MPVGDQITMLGPHVKPNVTRLENLENVSLTKYGSQDIRQLKACPSSRLQRCEALIRTKATDSPTS